MALIRHYPNNSTDYNSQGTSVTVNYGIVDMDGAQVAGQLDASLLTDEQVNQLCDAMRQAAALLPWVSVVNIGGVQNGRRTFTVTDDTPVNPG